MSLTTRSGVLADTDCDAWFEADQITGLSNNDPVGAWSDASSYVASGGATKQMQMGVSANKPLYKTNQRNGLPALFFDGINDYLESTPRQGTSRTMVLVRKLNSAGLGASKVQYQNSGPANSSGLGVFQSSAGPPGKHGAYLRAIAAPTSTTSTTTNWERIILCCGNSGGSAGNTRMYVNGTLVLSTTDDMATVNSDLGAHFIGKDDSGTLMSGEMLVGVAGGFKRSLSSGDVADLDTYLAGLWGDLPGTPTGLSVDAGSTNLELSWSAPVGGGTVTSYQVRIDGGSPSTATSPHDFTGLTPGTTHTLEVRALGPGGTGAWASIVEDTLEATGDPENVAAIDIGYESIGLEWDPPSAGGTVTSYQVRIDGGSPSTATSPHTFTGLSPGTSYSLEVRAVGPGGDSDWIEVTAETLDDTVAEGYVVGLRIGSHTWTINRGDDPDPDDPNPLAGATFSWGAPDDVGWPPRPWHLEPDTVTVRVIAREADAFDDVRRLDVVRFAFTPAGYGLTHPLVNFAGLITGNPRISRHPFGVVLEVTAVDYRVVLQMVTIFGLKDTDGGTYNDEPGPGGVWNVAVAGYDGRELIDGVPGGIDGGGEWQGIDEWINAALGFGIDGAVLEDYGLPWIDFPLELFDDPIDASPVVYQTPTITYEFPNDMVTLHDVYKAVSVYPWPIFDTAGNLTGFKFLDPHPDGHDYTLSEVDAGTVLGAVDWRRGVHPDWAEVRSNGEIVEGAGVTAFTRHTTGEDVEAWPDGSEPEVTKRLSLPAASFGEFNLAGFVLEVPTGTWFPAKMDVIADLAPETVDGWFNYPERVSKVVRIDSIEVERHPVDLHPLQVALEHDPTPGMFVGRLSRASLTINAAGRWTVTARLRPRLPAAVLEAITPP